VSSSKNYLGRYRLIRLIRGGQTCNVWDAVRDGETERVAIKALLAAHKNNREEIEQLRNEAKVCADMDHPNVIRIFEFNDRYEVPFVVMQLFNARNLKQEMRDNPEFVAINIPMIIRQGAEALRHVHERGWVHCDVKPDNFLVNEQGALKLIDFSIAQPMRQKRGLFAKRQIQGTRSYMAPEQIRGKRVDARTDLYGFGCVVHELLVGRPPFSGTSPDELLQKHLRAAPPTITAFNRNVSDDFANLILQILNKSPDKRLPGFDEFLKLLDKISVFRAGKRPTLGSQPA
jgi:serine/threonine-protein kinase